MQLVLASIQHTGTHWFINLFQQNGFGGMRGDGTPLPGVTHCWCNMHILDPSDRARLLALGQTRPTVMPLRHPYLVEETWRRRARNISELVEGFRIMAEEFSHAHVVPLDSFVREDRMRAFENAIGYRFERTWDVVHSLQGTAAMSLGDVEPSPEIRAVMAWDWMRQFY